MALVVCAILVATSLAKAHTVGSQEGILAAHLSFYAELFAAAHDGQAPSSWAEIETTLDCPLDTAYNSIKPTKRYAFLQRPLRLTQRLEGELHILTRRPFRGTGPDRKLGRYVVYRAPSGHFYSTRVDEEFIQNAFRGFEELLPTPDSEPLRPVEIQAISATIFGWLAAGIASVFLARWLVRLHAMLRRGLIVNLLRKMKVTEYKPDW